MNKYQIALLKFYSFSSYDQTIVQSGLTKDQAETIAKERNETEGNDKTQFHVQLERTEENRYETWEPCGCCDECNHCNSIECPNPSYYND